MDYEQTQWWNYEQTNLSKPGHQLGWGMDEHDLALMARMNKPTLETKTAKA